MAKSAPQVVPTDEDMAEFAREYPVASDQVSRLRSVGLVSGASGLAGALAVGAHSWKHNRMVAYLALGGILGGATAALVADDVRLLRLCGALQPLVRSLAITKLGANLWLVFLLTLRLHRVLDCFMGVRNVYV